MINEIQRVIDEVSFKVDYQNPENNLISWERIHPKKDKPSYNTAEYLGNLFS